MKHIHAESMALYAEDARVTDEPWKLWEVKVLSEWNQPLCSPAWLVDSQYRRKPKAILKRASSMELQDAYNKLDAAEMQISSLRAEQRRRFKIHQILIAAGFLTQEKINEASDILEGFPEANSK